MNSLMVVLNPAEHSRWRHRTVGRPCRSRRSLHRPRSEQQWWSSVAMHPVGPGLSQQTIGFCTKSSKRAESQDILSRSPGRFRWSAGCRLSLCTLGLAASALFYTSRSTDAATVWRTPIPADWVCIYRNFIPLQQRPLISINRQWTFTT